MENQVTKRERILFDVVKSAANVDNWDSTFRWVRKRHLMDYAYSAIQDFAREIEMENEYESTSKKDTVLHSVEGSEDDMFPGTEYYG